MSKTRRKHATLKQVAVAANVSVTTVSNFINGRLRFMSRETSDRVEAAIAKLSYRPHSAARELRSAQWRSVGIIIVDDSPNYLSEGISTHIVSGLSNFLGRHGFNLVIQGLQSGDLSRSSLVTNLKTDALCLMLSGKEKDRKSWIDVLMDLRQPVLIFQDRLATNGVDTCTVMQDDRGAGAMLAQHLFERGARSFVNLVPTNYHWAGISARLRGFDAWLRVHKVRTKTRIVTCHDRSAPTIWAALASDAQKHGVPDAILCNTDEMAAAAMKHIASIGKRIPDDVRIAGYNGIGLRDSTEPMLTTVESRGYDMGAIAGEVLIARLREGQFQQPSIKLPLKLQIGEST